MNELSVKVESTEISSEIMEATRLHQEILANINLACVALVEVCKLLKKMRDGKSYIHLGYESFEEYTVEALNIKSRQAYNYISAYERLGEPFLQSNASVGITKLLALSSVPVMDRQELVDSNDLETMSVDEVKKLVAENNAKGQQISLLSDEIKEKDEQIATQQKEGLQSADRIMELEAALSQKSALAEELERALETERNKPTEIAVAEPSAEDLEKIKKQAKKEASDELKEFKDKAAAEKKELLEKAEKEKQDAIQEYKDRLSAIDKEKAEAAQRATELEKKLAVSSSPDTVKFSFYFDELQTDFNKILGSIKKLRQSDPSSAEKFTAAMLKYTEMMRNGLTV